VRYLLLIGGEAGEETEPSSKEICEADDAVAWADEMTRRGVLVSGEVLHPPDEARTVRVRDDEVLLADGPFAETKEQIGGLCVIECAGLDDAVAVAAAHPVARFGVVEVRPLW
jgi:hypothetical protein